MKKYFLIALSCASLFSFAQQDLLSMLDSLPKPKTHEKVFATFKTTKTINAQTTETVKKHCLDFRITHRFGSVGAASGGGGHELYGWDDISDVRISFDYGLTDKMTIGVGRSKRSENIDAMYKWRFLEQTVDNKVPVSVCLYEDVAFTPMTDASLYSGTVDVTPNNLDRFSYVNQLIIARKFNRYFSLELLPTYQHRNYVRDAVNTANGAEDSNDLFALGAGARIKVSQRMAIVMDYFHVFSAYRNGNPTTPYYDPLSVGIEIETGGHVFHLDFTNALGIIENDFLPNTTDSWTNGGFKFGFNISRVFTF